MRVFLLRIFTAGCLALILFANGSATALTAREAETVVTILEKLKAQGVDITYDDDAAEDWFERDADEGKLITKAGFNEKTWKTALDETMKGFFATIPDAEVNKIFEDARKRLDGSNATAEQKKAVLEWIAEERGKIAALRTQGKAFASAVNPYSARLRKLTLGNLVER